MLAGLVAFSSARANAGELATKRDRPRVGFSVVGLLPHDDRAILFGGVDKFARMLAVTPATYEEVSIRLGGPFDPTALALHNRGDMRTAYGFIGSVAWEPVERWDLNALLGMTAGEARVGFRIDVAEGERQEKGRVTTPVTTFHAGVEARRLFGGALVRPLLGIGFRSAWLFGGEVEAEVAGLKVKAGDARDRASIGPALGGGAEWRPSAGSLRVRAEVWCVGSLLDRDPDAAGGSHLRIEPEARLGIATGIGRSDRLRSGRATRPNTASAEWIHAGDRVRFEISLENRTPQPQPAVVEDPIPAGASRLDVGSIQVIGSTTPVTDASSPHGGVSIRGIMVPPDGRATVRYVVYISEDLVDGAVLENRATVNGRPTNRATTPPVVGHAEEEGAIDAAKRYVGREPSGAPGGSPEEIPRGITTAPPDTVPVPPVPPVPPGQPPRVPPAEGCDCCCHLVPVWSRGPSIEVQIVTPVGDSLQVPIGGMLPFAVDGSDRDLLTLRCIKEGCGEKPCAGCSGAGEIDLPGTLRYRWEVVDGPGALVTSPPFPHPHSALVEGPATIYVAPDTLVDGAKVTLRLTVDDGPEYIADIDDAPVERIFHIILRAQVDHEPPTVAPRSGPARSSAHTSEGGCSCRPVPAWAAASPPSPRATPPDTVVVCARGYVVLAAAGSDVDRLSARCVDPKCASPEQAWMLNDAPRYLWKTGRGRIFGTSEKVVYEAPDAPGRDTVSRTLDDSGVHPGPADEAPVPAKPVTIFVFKSALLAVKPIRTGLGKGYEIQYAVDPPPADAARIEIFDAKNRRIRTLDDLPVGPDYVPGVMRARWDGLDDAGRPVVERGGRFRAVLVTRRGTAECRSEKDVPPWERVRQDKALCGGIEGTIDFPASARKKPRLVVVYVEGECEACARVPHSDSLVIHYYGMRETLNGIQPHLGAVPAGTPIVLVNGEEKEIDHAPRVIPEAHIDWQGDRRRMLGDVGVLRRGERATIGYSRPGRITLHCELHKFEDATFFVTPNECYSAIVVPEGVSSVDYSLENLLAGTYTIRVFALAPHRDVGPIAVTVEKGNITRRDIKITR